MYLADILAAHVPTVTRIARGLRSEATWSTPMTSR